MKKIILSLLTVLTLFACTSMQLTPEQSAIARVLRLDLSYPANAGSISTLVVSQETTSLAGCPKDFIAAYNDSIAAWKKFASIEKQMYEQNYSKARKDINTFLTNFVNDPTGSVVNLKNQWPQFSKEIDIAFTAVRQSFVDFTNIASNYGVPLPKKSLWNF